MTSSVLTKSFISARTTDTAAAGVATADCAAVCAGGAGFSSGSLPLWLSQYAPPPAATSAAMAMFFLLLMVSPFGLSCFRGDRGDRLGRAIVDGIGG